MSPTPVSTPISNSGITLIGIGNMGLALALALLKASNPRQVTIWNRTHTRPQVQTAIAAGAVLEPNLARAISLNEVIIVCLLDYESIRTAFSADAGAGAATAALTGKTLINLTNGTMKQARDMQSWAVQVAGVKNYFDGAVMVTPQMVGGPHSFLVVSGGAGGDSAQGDMDQEVRSLLSPLGRVEYLGGSDIEAAARFDLAALACMYGMFSGGFIGMGLLKRRGGNINRDDDVAEAKKQPVEIGRVIKEEIVPFLTALVPYLGLIAESWDGERWEENLGNPVGMQLQAVRNIAAACREEGVEDVGGMLDGLADLMGKVVERHGSDAGIAGVGELLLEKRLEN